MKSFVSGLAGGGKAWYALERLGAHPAVIVLAADEELISWNDNLTALAVCFDGAPVYAYPSDDHFARLTALKKLTENPAGIVVTTAEALASPTTAPADFGAELVRLLPGRDYEFNAFMASLARLGYQRADFVEERGQFSRRGEILDIWSPDQTLPWRILFSQNTLESVRTFDVVTQRSDRAAEGAALLPVVETAGASLADYLPANTLLLADTALTQEQEGFCARFDCIVNDPLNPEAANHAEDFKAMSSWAGNIKLFAQEARQFIVSGYRPEIFCANEGERERVEDILAENRIAPDDVELRIGPLSDGFYSFSRKKAVFSAQEVLYKRRPVTFPKFKTGRRLEGLWEISAGDYVVHEKYGIGRYLGLKRISSGEQQAEYLCIEFKGGDKLYVPPDDFRVVQKYVGIEGTRPRLYSMDTGAWERVKQRAAESARELAEELIKLYAERNAAPGHAFPPDTPWERELADSFPYQETPDQLTAIEDVKRDLEMPRPMERVVCGDVGFGKTEVAVRAAFKAVQDSKQVAVLVPTTVLAEQHYQTFTNRLAPFPTRVALISRFQSRAEQKRVISGIRAGTIDIVVGTHRLLQKDVAFKDLGLLIIDEEHRFGVAQKEKVKKLKSNIDVLLLSATPIPRTLSLALSHLRDLSVIETPPYGRLPIETHMGPYDEKLVQRIIKAELSRGGQVYYVHNRVQTIFSRAAYLQRLVPDVRWGVIHGQMPAQEIERTMWAFLHKKIDILIATSIIESGLDIPSVNTMLVEEAENFGLAQLYQLRGRIGREKQKAYCYLFYTPEYLTEESRKRLESLQEFSELGSGFRLALRDLEIRGAGNILSARQHGFVKDIGFELYSRLIEEASASLTGAGTRAEKRRATLDFAAPAYLPSEYIAAEDLRILFYRRLSDCASEAELERIREELADRFGPLPSEAVHLLQLTKLRLLAESKDIKSLVEEPASVTIYFWPDKTPPPDAVLALARAYGDEISILPGAAPGLRLAKPKARGLSALVEKMEDFLARLGHEVH